MSFEGNARAVEPRELPEKLEVEISQAKEESIPFMQKLQIDYDVSDTAPRPLKIGDLAGTEAEGFQTEPRGPDPEISKEDFLEEFKRSAGSLRGKNAKEKENQES